VPGIILPFNFSMALCAASALLKSTKQYPAGFLERQQSASVSKRKRTLFNTIVPTVF